MKTDIAPERSKGLLSLRTRFAIGTERSGKCRRPCLFDTTLQRCPRPLIRLLNQMALQAISMLLSQLVLLQPLSSHAGGIRLNNRSELCVDLHRIQQLQRGEVGLSSCPRNSSHHCRACHVLEAKSVSLAFNCRFRISLPSFPSISWRSQNSNKSPAGRVDHSNSSILHHPSENE